MRPPRLVRRALAVGIVGLALAGCAAKFSPPLRAPGAFAAELHGRLFSFLVLEDADAPGGPDRFLQIEGDGVIVSFHVSARPYVPTIRDNAVHMGGHVFAVTATPNAFLVDGQPHTLPRGGLYIVSDGQYAGRYGGR
jgi:hypothetical protein